MNAGFLAVKSQVFPIGQCSGPIGGSSFVSVHEDVVEDGVQLIRRVKWDLFKLQSAQSESGNEQRTSEEFEQ